MRKSTDNKVRKFLIRSAEKSEWVASVDPVGIRTFRFEGCNVYSLICGNGICLCYESEGTRENPGYFKEDTLILSLGRGKDCNILSQTDFR